MKNELKSFESVLMKTGLLMIHTRRRNFAGLIRTLTLNEKRARGKSPAQTRISVIRSAGTGFAAYLPLQFAHASLHALGNQCNR